MRSAVRFLLLATLLAACGDAGSRAATNAADTSAAAPEPETPYGWMPPPGDSAGPVGSIGDPEKAFQVVASLKEWSIEISPSSIPAGEVTIALENNGERPHQIEVHNSRAGRWTSAIIPPGAMVTMTMPMPPASYDVVSMDTSYVERGMKATLVVR